MASLTVVDVVALLIALFLLSNLCKREYQRRTGIERSARLPPGPSAIPLIGNVHQLPTEYQEKTFFEWGRQYGADPVDCLLLTKIYALHQVGSCMLSSFAIPR